MVYVERASRRQQFHVEPANSAESTPLQWTVKTRYEKGSHSLETTCDKKAVSLLETRE